MEAHTEEYMTLETGASLIKDAVQSQWVFRITYLSKVDNYRDVAEAHNAE